VETRDGTVLISISEKTRRTTRSKYPLHDELIKQYRQSQAYRDFIAEGRDACSDPNVFDIEEVKTQRMKSDLLDDHAVEVERAIKLFTCPVETFRVAQIWDRMKKQRFGRAFRQRFAEELEAAVAPACVKEWAKCNPVTRLRALDEYLGQSSSLLKQWIKSGKVASRWWIENAIEVYRLQHAQEQVQHVYITDYRGALSVHRSSLWETSFSPNLAQSDLSYDFVTRVLLGTQYLVDQHNIREAARSASYLTFRRFLIEKIKVRLCAWCGGVFETGKKTEYCCTDCAKSHTCAKAKSAYRTHTNQKRVVAGIEILEKWLERTDLRRRPPWRAHLEYVFRDRGLIDANNHPSQIVGQWVNAAHTVDESPKRKRIARLCTTSRLSCREGTRTAELVDTLLALIVRAEKACKQ
jgi:hypothetical protein